MIRPSPLSLLSLSLPLALALGACSSAPASDSALSSGASAPVPSGDAGGPENATSEDAGSVVEPAAEASAPHPSPGAPTAADGGSNAGQADAGGSSSKVDYAPYFPTWIWGGSGYAVTGLADLQAKSGLNEVTIAFVLSNGGCDTTQDIEQNASDVKAFLAAGGHVKASFGGADGDYVESKCSDAASFATALEGFVDADRHHRPRFHIEQDAVLTDAVNEMRGQALKLAQDARGIKVAFTLAANPSPGALTSQGLSVVSHALAAGVTISHVNLMTMDYGDSLRRAAAGARGDRVAHGGERAAAHRSSPASPRLRRGECSASSR